MSHPARAAAWLTAFTVLALAAPGQKPAAGTTKDDDDVVKSGPVDPFTGGDPAAMAAAGVVAYGPFPWADFHSTADIDHVLGEGRVLWMETAHFRLGLNLKTVGWPEEADQRKALQDELKQLHRLLPKLPERPKKLDPWIRLHLYAQRVEGAYRQFLKLIGATDADFPARGKEPGEGAYLGLPDKFLVLLFQKKSDMSRYMETFCGRKCDSSMRYYHDKTNQMLACISAEGMEGFNEAGLHGHVLYAVYHNLLNGYDGFRYSLPLWFDEGFAHWYSRQVPSSTMNVEIRDDEAVAEDKQNDWAVKVRRRAQHEGAFFTFETMAAWTDWEKMGYHAHAQSWSRVDYLMQHDPEKVGLMVRQLKHLPEGPDYEALGVQARARAQQLLVELFGLDGPTFDEKWREWVLKTYPRK